MQELLDGCERCRLTEMVVGERSKEWFDLLTHMEGWMETETEGCKNGLQRREG